MCFAGFMPLQLMRRMFARHKVMFSFTNRIVLTKYLRKVYINHKQN